jgi:hypothetical protein
MIRFARATPPIQSASMNSTTRRCAVQIIRWQAPHQKQRLSLTTPAIHTLPLGSSQSPEDEPDIQKAACMGMAVVLTAMLDSSQYELLERFCSRAGERVLKRLCAPPDSSNAFSAWSKAKNESPAAPYLTAIAMHVVGGGRMRGLMMYAGYSDGRINSMHFHFGDTV